MNDAEIMELVDEVRRCERAVQQAKNALEIAKRDAAVAVCPYKEGDIVSDGIATAPVRQRSIKSSLPLYPYYDLRVLPITERGKPSRRHRYAYNVLDVTPYEGDE
ncbi:MAG: hypothetical protein ACLRWP_09930 [Bilophila wadsworthia]